MLKNIFVSEVRVKILKTILPNLGKAYHVRALVRVVGAEINAVRRELLNLTNIGLLRKRQSGNKIFYTADPLSPYFTELLALVSKEEGLAADIIRSQKSLGDLKFAIISKAFLLGRVSSPLDVDVFLVGNVNMEVLSRLVKNEEARVSREINYTVMPEAEFVYRKRKNDNFISKVLAQSRVMVVGDEEEFCSLIS